MLSVFLPTIRTHLLEKWYSTLELSCDRHEFEVVFCGPFTPPDSLIHKENVSFIQDYGSPTRSAQLAAISCKGDFLYHTVDDILFNTGVISNELDTVESNRITAMRYVEGVDYGGGDLPISYWYATNAYRGYSNVNPKWGIGVHFLMRRSLFVDYGGFNCDFEYLNHATHDLLFRLQANGIKYKTSNEVASTADWMPGTSGDHAAIHYAQTTHDDGLFRSLWHNYTDSRREVKLDNWSDQKSVWDRRFNIDNLEKKYEDLNHR